ncbi:MAG: hypothetical protein ACNYWU_08915 [Desulfobacterales bacterium]
MSFLSDIFGKKLGHSYVRSWAKEKERRAGNSNDTALDGLFGGMIFGISSFGENLKPDRKTKLAINNKKYEKAPYSGDASLFEVACYFLFETDLWLYNNKPKYRGDVFTYLFQRLAELFSYALKVDNIHDLITDRLEQYGEIAIKENDAEIYIELLSELVRRTKYNTLPQEYELKASIYDGYDIFDDFFLLKMLLANFIAHMLKAHFQILENFFRLVDTDE